MSYFFRSLSSQIMKRPHGLVKISRDINLNRDSQLKSSILGNIISQTSIVRFLTTPGETPQNDIAKGNTQKSQDGKKINENSSNDPKTKIKLNNGVTEEIFNSAPRSFKKHIRSQQRKFYNCNYST